MFKVIFINILIDFVVQIILIGVSH